VEKALATNAKIVIPAGSELVNVIGELAGVLLWRRRDRNRHQPSPAATGRATAGCPPCMFRADRADRVAIAARQQEPQDEVGDDHTAPFTDRRTPAQSRLAADLASCSARRRRLQSRSGAAGGRSGGGAGREARRDEPFFLEAVERGVHRAGGDLALEAVLDFFQNRAP